MKATARSQLLEFWSTLAIFMSSFAQFAQSFLDFLLEFRSFAIFEVQFQQMFGSSLKHTYTLTELISKLNFKENRPSNWLINSYYAPLSRWYANLSCQYRFDELFKLFSLSKEIRFQLQTIQRIFLWREFANLKTQQKCFKDKLDPKLWLWL